MNNLSPSPEKIENPKTQSINADVLNLLKSKGKKENPPEVEQAKNRLKKILQQFGIPPEKVVQAGKYAKEGLFDPKKYQMAINVALKEGILTPDQVPKGPGIDRKLLASAISAGKLAQMIIDEGKA